MKKLFTFFALAIFTFTSCSDDGEMGPQGPQGPPGEDGLIGIIFDVEGDFTEDNDYSLEANYSDFTDEEVFETDVVLVYLNTGQIDEDQGEPVYAWRLLPQTYYVDGGTVQYNYDFSYFSTYIFLDSDVEYSSLSEAFTENQMFRIAILPATYASDLNLDVSDYNAVMKTLEINDREIPTLKLEE